MLIRLKSHKALTGIILLSLFLRFYQLDHQSFWFEELMSLYYAKADSVMGFFKSYYKIPDASPPLYPFFIFIIRSMNVYSDWIYRAPSACFGVGIVIMTYCLGGKIFGKSTGLLAAGLAVFSGALIYYSQEVRYNSFLVFFILTFTFLFIDFHNQRSSPKRDLLLMLNASVLVFLHYVGILFMVEILFLSIIFQIKNRNFSKKIFWFSLLIFLLFLPWLSIFVTQLSVWTINPAAATPPNLIVYFEKMLEFALVYKPYWEINGIEKSIGKNVLYFIVLFLIFSLVVLIKAKRKHTYEQWLSSMTFGKVVVGAIFIGNILIFFLHDYFAKNKYFYEKNLLFTLPFFYIGIAALFDKIYTKKEGVIITAVIILAMSYVSLFQINYFHRTFKTEFRHSAQAISKMPVMPILVLCGDPRWYDYYFSKYDIKNYTYIKDELHFDDLLKKYSEVIVTYSHCFRDELFHFKLDSYLKRKLFDAHSLSHAGIYQYRHK